MDDWQLLREYAERGSEAAFEALVGRYLGMVHGVAVREVGEHTLADDVTQAVFALLAKKAAELREGTVIAGWLFQTARYAAANATKMERRRRHHEMQAARMKSEELEAGEAGMDRLHLLDCALERLGERDRGAVLMRYYRRMEMEEICRALGVSEVAARRRIERAVGKLRVSMGAETGTSVTTEMLGVMGVAAAKTAQSAASGALAVANGGTGALGQEMVNFLMKRTLVRIMRPKWASVAAMLAGVVVIAGAWRMATWRSPERHEVASAPPAPATEPAVAKGYVYMMGVEHPGIYAILDSPSSHTMKEFLVAGGIKVDDGGLVVRLIRREGATKELIREIHLDGSLVAGEWKMEIFPSDVLIVMGRNQAMKKFVEDREMTIVPASGDPHGGDPNGDVCYLQGQVQRMGAYQLAPGKMTILQAIVAADALGEVESLKVKVIRREAADRESHFELNISDLLAGRVSDRYLQASDLVVVSKDISMPRDEVSVVHTP